MNSQLLEELCKSESRLKKHIKNKLSVHKQRSYTWSGENGTDAAVLIPIFFKNDEAHLLFTQRTDKVEHHKGQISFPGGRKDDVDPDLKFTALRETEEEVGIVEQDVSIIGQTDRFLTNTLYMVTPFVGFYKHPYPYQVSVDEIDRLIEVPLLSLMDDESFTIKPLTRNNVTWQIHYYTYQGDVIWGVTGFLLSNFLEIVFELPRMSDVLADFTA